MSWRDDVVARLDDMCALRPPPPGYKISTSKLPYWRIVSETPRDDSLVSYYTPDAQELSAAFDQIIRRATGK